MKKLLLFVVVLLCASSAKAQTPVVGASCSPAGLNGITAGGVPVVCTQPSGGGALVWTATGGGTSSGSSTNAPGSSVFYMASNCNGLTSCFQAVDDDSTDNCGSSLTTWMSAVNSYSGAGQANVFILGSGSGKAYKFAACNLVFTGPSGTGGQAGGIIVQSQATIDCAQASGNCIQMGKSGCSTSSYYGTGCHDMTWRGGTFIGGLNNSPAMFEYTQGMFLAVHDDTTFINTGAGNATLGNCTNYSIQFDTFIGGIEFSRNKYYGTVQGQCFSNNNDTTGGANTVQMRGNMISHSTAGSTCGSQGHFDSSTHSSIENNLFFGFAAPLQIANSSGGDDGWLITGNNFDSSVSCTPSGASNTGDLWFGGPNSVGPVTVINNDFFTSPAISQYPGTAATMSDWTIYGNDDSKTSGGLAVLIAGNPTCGALNIGASPSTPCFLGANQNFQLAPSGQATGYKGFANVTGDLAHAISLTQAANLTATNIDQTNIPIGYYLVTCQVIVTQQATTSATVPTCVIGWTDGLTSVAATQTVAAGGNGGTNPAVGTQTQGVAYILAKNATHITYATGSYASSGATPMQYAVFADVTKLF